jgi:hypothetical protein
MPSLFLRRLFRRLFLATISGGLGHDETVLGVASP